MRVKLLNAWTYYTQMILEFLLPRILRYFYQPPVPNEEDVKGKITLVTGANCGIGKATAHELAKRGAIVIMACRNISKGEMAKQEILRKVPNATLHVRHLDLGNLESIRKFSKEIHEEFTHINILINNAGVAELIKEKHYTADGFEMHMGTNHLGHFLMTRLLEDLVKKAEAGRIVIISSSLALSARLDTDDWMLNSKTDFAGYLYVPYSNSKLANNVFALELGERLQSSGVTTYSVCPSLVATEVFRHLTSFHAFFNAIMVAILSISPKAGTETILYCALSRNCKNETGRNYMFGKIFKAGDQYTQQNRELGKVLWKMSEEAVGLSNPN